MYQDNYQITANNLLCLRDERILFKDLSFAVQNGKVLLVEGRNGAGKTTLLRILSGLRQADEGDVCWNEQDIRELGFEYYQYVSFLGHHNAIKKDLSARENLEVSIALSAGSEVGIEEALNEVKLAGYEDEPAKKFSAGMCRRLAIAKLLVLDTPLWVLDEPFTSVDVKGIEMIENFIVRHVKKGGSVIMTSHHAVNIDEKYIQRLRLS